MLVFPCGSEIGLELHRSLADSTFVNLHGASSASDHGRYVYARYIGGLPFVDEPEFLDAINRAIAEHRIDFLFPAHDSAVMLLAENEKRLRCRVLGSPVETCRICRSKRLTYKTFESLLRVPRVYGDVESVEIWPAFLKPDVGQGSRGAVLAQNREEARFLLAQDASRLLLEYLPGAEYTVDCFTDRHGHLRFAGARERVRISGGISVNSHTVKDEAVERIATAINGRLSFRGAWFFQLRQSSGGELALLEIAPRVAGTAALYRNLGVNLALLTVFDAMGLDVEILRNNVDMEIDRALTNRFSTEIGYRHLYMDLDDSLIRDGKVHLLAVALLYQALNNGVELHLLTRHVGSVDELLERHRLKGMFHDIVHLGTSESKSEHIKHLDAVFIDDSFAERASVSRTLGIPVFDLDAIESLLDWKR